MNKSQFFMLMAAITLTLSLLPSAQANIMIYNTTFETGTAESWTVSGSGTNTVITSGALSGTYSMQSATSGGLANLMYSRSPAIGDSLNENRTYNLSFMVNSKINPVADSVIFLAMGDTVWTGANQYNQILKFDSGVIKYYTAFNTIKTSSTNYAYNTNYRVSVILKPVDNYCEIYLDTTRVDTGDCWIENARYTNPIIQFHDTDSSNNMNIVFDDVFLYEISTTDVLKVTAKNQITNADILVFNVSLYDETNTLLKQNTTSSGELYINITDLALGNYTIYMDAENYQSKNATIEYLNDSINYVFYTYFVPLINVNFKDEISRNTLGNVTYKLIFADVATEIFAADGTDDLIRLNSTGLLEIEYQKNGYSIRHYFVNITEQSNTTLDLYLLNDGNATEISYLITDQAGVSLQDAYISVLRRYVVSGVPVFEVVEMAKSNNEGKGSIYVQKNDATYKFLASYNDETILITNPAQIFQNSIVLKGTVGESVTQSLYEIQGLQHSLTYSGNAFTLTWADTTGILDEICLNVYRTRSAARTLFNDTCSTANTGSISLGIDNTTTAEYMAVAVVDTTTQFSEHVLITLVKKIDDLAQTIGISGVFFTAIFVIVGGTIAVFSPVAGILLTVAALIFSSLIGFVSISMPVIFLITAVGGVLLYAFRRGGA